jgi:hypothetical protein
MTGAAAGQLPVRIDGKKLWCSLKYQNIKTVKNINIFFISLFWYCRLHHHFYILDCIIIFYRLSSLAADQLRLLSWRCLLLPGHRDWSLLERAGVPAPSRYSDVKMPSGFS